MFEPSHLDVEVKMKNYMILMLCFFTACLSILSARELVSNGDFDNSFVGWTDWKISDAVDFEKSIDTTGLLSGANSAKFDILAGSDTDWHIQFHNSDFVSQKSAKYYVSFKAGFDGPMDSLSLPLAMRNTKSGAAPILMQYNAKLPFILDAGSERFQFVYEADTTISNTHLNFFLGGHNEVVLWIDDISIQEEGPFWLNTPFENMDDAVEVNFSVYPDSAFKGLVGLSLGDAASEDDVVCGLYFEPNGALKALNGSVLQSVESVEYDMDQRISVTLFANISKQRYDVTVKPIGQDEQILASNYAFKKMVNSLNTIVSHTDINPDNGGRPMTSMRVSGIKTTAKTHVAQTSEIPTEIDLVQNYPNPFNPATTIIFSLAQAEHVSIDIFDTAGKHVKNLLNEYRAPGRSEIHWDSKDKNGRHVASGVYYVRLKAGQLKKIHKMVLAR
jgi:hypothetical protein